MKIFALIFSVFISSSAFANSGFDQLQKLFNEGSLAAVKDLKTIDQGIYTGRCFERESDRPFGSYIAFKNLSADSGPIAVDPLLYIGFGSVAQSDYFDQAPVSQTVSHTILNQAEMMSDKLTFEIKFNTWILQIRKNGDYIIQRNIVAGSEDSFCYFYQFRSSTAQ